MAKDFILELEFELLLVGGILLSLILIPISPIRRLGNFINNALYRIRLSSPFPQIINGTVSLTLLVGLLGLVCSTYLFLNYYRRYVNNKDFASRKTLSDRDNVTRFREERNIYIWASSAVVYLALHTFGRLAHQTKQAEQARTRQQARNAVAAMEEREQRQQKAETIYNTKPAATAATTTESASDEDENKENDNQEKEQVVEEKKKKDE